MHSADGTTGSSSPSSARSGPAATSSTWPCTPLLLRGADLHYLLAATGSFLVAVTNNYTWNRVWTFRGQRGHVAYQGLRFLVVSTIALAANLAAAVRARPVRRRRAARPGARDRARNPAQLRGEQALVVPKAIAALRSPSRARRACCEPRPHRSEPVYDEDGRLVQAPFVPSSASARLTEQRATTSCCATRRSRRGSIATHRSRRPTPSIGPRRTSGS